MMEFQNVEPGIRPFKTRPHARASSDSGSSYRRPSSVVSVIGNAAQTVTTTQVTTVPTTVTTNSAANSSGQLNAEQIYANSNRSIVTIQGTQVQNSLYGNQVASILGSGFVVSYSGVNYIVTNYHVAGATTNLTVT